MNTARTHIATQRWRRSLTLLLVSLLVLLLVIYLGLWWLMATASVTTHGEVDLGAGNLEVPDTRSVPVRLRSPLTDSLISSWAERDFADWQAEGKVNMPRVLAAKLKSGRDIPAVNKYLLAARVRGTVGSTGPFHPEGDYDFTLAGLCLILYAFGDSPELLYPETVDHIVQVLMTEDGGNPRVFTPKLLGLPLRDTENHILMTEGSRYLKNRWLRLHGDTNPRFDNRSNGLSSFLLEYLSHMERAGFHEYNSRPYIGYTLTALLNLQSFADEPVRTAAQRILDRANWEYALGSLQFRRFPPFRRQARRAHDTDLDGDYHTAMVKAWMSQIDPDYGNLDIRAGEHQALWVPFTDYQLPDKTARWIKTRPNEYFVRLGHGHDGSPEIYSGGPGFLITAGGVARDRFEQAVARPTTLMLNDGVLDVSEVLQITGEGSDHRQWNNTGVHRRFAVGKRVSVPVSWQPDSVDGSWAVYQRQGHNIIVYADDDIALFYLPGDGDPGKQLNRLMALNKNRNKLLTGFVNLSGELTGYDTDAELDVWVINAVAGVPIRNRQFGSWSLMSGWIDQDGR